MGYLITWSNGEEVEYLFLPEGSNLEKVLEPDRNYIIAQLNIDNAQ